MSMPKRTLALLLAVGAGPSLWAQTITCAGAELFSKPTVKYGRWEIRMQTAATPGSVSSFFTYYNNSWEGSPEPWREIDIEVLGNNPESFQSNLITGVYVPSTRRGKITSEAHHTVSGMSSAFHTFVLDWTPDSVVWRVDGRTLRKTPAGNSQVTELREKPQSWRMNLWSSTDPDWVGRLDLSKLPVYQVVNWMRFSDYTPGAGANGSNFTQSWIDDFSTFNSTRWDKGDWKFEGNQAQLMKSNIAVKDGYLVLALTRPGEEGVKQTVPKDPAGNTYTTSVSDRAVTGSFKAWNVSSGLRIEGAGAAAVQVLDAQGRLVAQARSGETTIPLASKGVLFVRAGELSTTVVR